MKYHLLLALLLTCFVAQAQDVKFPALDPSPADIVYYPLNAPKAKDTKITPIVKVIYSRPQKKGREVFGVLEQFGKVWRTGANESTEIRFYKKVKVGEKTIRPGIYSLFAIPNKDKWTIIINKQTDKWGAFAYDQTMDILRADVPVIKSAETIEAFSITFTDTKDGAKMVLGWDKTIVELPLLFNKD